MDLATQLHIRQTKMRKGKFVVFEGIDGSGKTSQMKLLGRYLKSKKLKFLETYEPTDGPVGKLIRKALRHEIKFSWETLQLMYSADRADHLDKLIKPSIQKGIIVLADRYFFSTFAFGELNLDSKWLRALNSQFQKPDITFLVDTPANVAIKRITTSRGSKELFEKEKKLEKVRKNYLLQAKEFSFYVLDGTKTIDEIHEEILEILKKKKYV